MEKYITDNEFQKLLEDILKKIESKDFESCQGMLEEIIQDTKSKEKYIDRTYLGNIETKKRMSRIAEIDGMLEKMSIDQINNVHHYTVDEYDEPNHEAEALEAIVRLSRKK